MERAFSSGVRCLATDADSDVVWAGDEAGRLAVFRCEVTGLRGSWIIAKQCARVSSPCT